MKKLFLLGLMALCAANVQAQWSLTGNAGTNPPTNFLGTTDDKDVVFKRNNIQAGLLTDLYGNTSFGVYALNPSTTGTANTAIGKYALFQDVGGMSDVAIGSNSLYSNTGGSFNTAVGNYVLYSNTTGDQNTGTGGYALQTNTTGSSNVAYGWVALNQNTTGTNNTALGNNTLKNNTYSSYNTAVGSGALSTNTVGTNNTAVGYNSGTSYSYQTNSTALGNGATTTASSTVMLGNTTNYGVYAYGAYFNLSDGRFKKNIQENVPGLEFIDQLKPVTYTYKIREVNSFIGGNNNVKKSDEADKTDEEAIDAKEKIVYTGFVAQEVEKAAEKIGYNFSGLSKPKNDKDPYALSYAEFVVPLVKAVQELSAKNDDKQNQINQLNDKLNLLQEKLDALINKNSGTNNLELNNNTAIVLDQNAPNPFAESTTISYTINSDFNTALISIVDNNGVVIKTYPVTTKGKAQLTVYGSNLSSGVYHYSLIVDGKTIETKSMVKN